MRPDVMRADLWYRISAAAGLVAADGSVNEPVFSTMTALAAQLDAVNLGQGAPGTNPDPLIVDTAAQAMRDGINQYPPGQGNPDLIAAVCRQRQRDVGQRVEPDEVLITVGATEGITAAVLALVPAGGTVIAFEPFYDSYPAAAAAAGADFATVPLLPVDSGDGLTFEPDWDAFDAVLDAAAAGPGVAIILNDPHNPTGKVFAANDLERVFAAAQAANAWIITDEVYEHLTFGPEHRSIAALVSDPQRIVSISSAGKTFNVTGWKIGWLIADPPVRRAIQAVKQYLTYMGGAPLQPAIARALDAPELAADNRSSLDLRREVLLDALGTLPGVRVADPDAGYFSLVDFSALTELDATAVNELIARHYGIVGIPVAALCHPGSPTAQAYRGTIRYSFCKNPDDMKRAAQRIRTLGQAITDGAFPPA